MHHSRCKWLAVAALALLTHSAAQAADTIPSNQTTTATRAVRFWL
jgi:hypothetical protein